MDVSDWPYTRKVLEIWAKRKVVDSHTFAKLKDIDRGTHGRLWNAYNTKFVQEIYDLIGKAAEEGFSYIDFKTKANQICANYGNINLISGGEFSSNYADLVIRTNTQAQYAAGRYSQMFTTERQRTVPYVLYHAVIDEDTRPSHAALDGMVFRKDDLTARTLYPPNGYRCRCRLIELDQSEVEEGGYRVTGGNQVIGQEVITNGHTSYIGPEPGWNADRVQSLVPNVLKGT